MRFGIFSVVDHYLAEFPRTSGQFYGELLEQAEAAEQLGFGSFWIAAHHFHAVGSPDDVAQVARLCESAGLTDFLAIANFGALPHRQVLRSMEPMAQHVLPQFPR